MPSRRLGLRRAATSALVLVCASFAVAVAQVDQPETAYARSTLGPSTEVWQQAEAPYDENRSNPLANRVWGVYQGPQDQASGPYLTSNGKRRELLSKIGLRPKTKWYGAFVPDNGIRATVQSHIAAAQAGDPERLVQIAVFRMKPWEHEACERRSTPAEKRSYRRWINELAAGIGATPMLVVMQPDGPFLWCTPDPAAKSRLLTYATRKLSSLSRTSVYIDA